MSIFLAVIAAIVPTAIYALMIWWLDRYEKEPLPLLTAAFLWGSLPAVAIAVVLTPLIDLPIAATPFGIDLGIGIIAPAIEEIAKAVPLLALYAFRRHEIDGPLDGIVYGALVGFGFAMTENLLFFLAYPADLPLLFWVRGVIFGLNHALFSAVVGLALGVSRLQPHRRSPLLLAGALFLAITLHALHNIAATYQLPGLTLSWMVQSSGVLVIVAVAVLAWRHEAAWIKQELGSEIAYGIIGPADYAAVISAPRRAHSEFQALLNGGWRHYRQVALLHHHMTKLAFSKVQLRQGLAEASPAGCDRLRREIVALRSAIAGDSDSLASETV